MGERGTSAVLVLEYRELKLLSFDLDAVCVNVMPNDLPERFASFVDGHNPSIEDVRVAALRNSMLGKMNRTNGKALAARLIDNRAGRWSQRVGESTKVILCFHFT